MFIRHTPTFLECQHIVYCQLPLWDFAFQFPYKNLVRNIILPSNVRFSSFYLILLVFLDNNSLSQFMFSKEVICHLLLSGLSLFTKASSDFTCTGNSRKSEFTKTEWNYYWQEEIKVYSYFLSAELVWLIKPFSL